MPRPRKLSIDQALSLAKKAISQGKSTQAEQLYRSILSHQPHHPAAKKGLRKLQEHLQEKQALSPKLADPPRETIDAVRNLYRSGKLAEAEQTCKKLLFVHPRSETVLTILGATLRRLGKLDDALSNYEQAIQLNPRHAVIFNNRGNVLKEMGRFEDALKSFDQAIQLNSTYMFVYNNRGITLQELHRFDEALANFDKAIQLDPQYLEAHNNKGITLRKLGRLNEALASFDLAIQLNPQHAEAHNNRGIALQETGRLKEALTSFRSAIQLNPQNASVHSNHGNVLREMGRFEEALSSYEKAIQLNPKYDTVYNNRGITLRELGKLDEALSDYDKAIQLNPQNAEAHSNRGNALREMGRLEEALSSYEKAIQLNPQYAEVYNNRGVTLRALGRLDEAETAYREALKLKPDYAEALSNRLFCLSHSEAIDTQMLFTEHCRFGEQFEAHLRANWPQHGNSRDLERCLKVGFVSADLRNHAVAFFIEPVLAHLAGYPQLSLHAYYNYAIEDGVTQRLQRHLKHWHSIVGLTDEELANKIREDGIDILIDLSGHTAKHRLLAFARKPAPVQVSWIGYPGTTGLKAMDYRIASNNVPRGQFGAQFIEKLVYLPASVPFMMFEDAPPVNTLPALANGYITFGSFNRKSKITRSVIALWSQLLRALPNASMVLGAMPPVGEHNPLIEWFVEEGIDLERLSFYPKCPMKEYLGLHHQVDLCLDTFPYTGSTTTTHALWMGVPTLTIMGKSIAGGAGALQLGHLGLEKFITHNKTEFVKRGLYWADNLTKLGHIRNGLRARFRQSALGRPDIIAAAFERALRIMWQRWCDGLPTESFEVPWQ